VRYRLMASYQGSPFEAGIGPTEGDIVLFAACPPPEELGFEPATGHWRKQLRVGDVQAVWESRPVGTFRGERCMVLDDLGDRLHIGYLGHDGFKAEQLGYWQVDRGVFELVAPRTEVTEILEERTEKPRAAPSSPAADDYGLSRSPGTSGQYAAPTEAVTPRASGQYPVPAGFGLPESGADGSRQPTTAYMPVPDSTTGVALPVAAEAPLPLEAEAMRAASAARRPRPTARRGVAAIPPPTPPAAPAAATTGAAPSAGAAMPPLTGNSAAAPLAAAVPEPAPAPTRQRRAARRRMATERLFADLATLAGIPVESYAVGEAVDGALCLVQTEQGFEVFHSAAGARHELQVFATEESACFYLFGVLAAEAVRNGSLARVFVPAGMSAGQPEPA
jgi:hypothetical protein